MATALALTIPDPNSERSVLQHRDAVLSQCSNLFTSIDRAFIAAVPQAHDLFGLLGGTPDRAVHATVTRYIVRTLLEQQGVTSEDEVQTAELEWVPNCGICIHVPGIEIRVLKASNGAIPKANSDTRTRFYCSNQLQLFADLPATIPSSLKLVALWDLDDQYRYTGLTLACPRLELDDKSVDCFWQHRWSDSRVSVEGENDLSEDRDLDIRPVAPDSDR